MANIPLPEHPRPDKERSNWIPLNGEWHFSVFRNGEKLYENEITVPFPPESKMSGVERTTMPDETIIYQRTVKIGKKEDRRYIISFLAVDYECTLLVNGRKATEHKGGYLPFSADITDFILTDETTLELIVTDPTDTGEQARGKQTLKPHQIWYGPVSGIWQSVWIDIVPRDYITALRTTPDVDKSSIGFFIATSRAKSETATLTIDGKTAEVPTNRAFTLKLDEPKLWSPEEPNLYEYRVSYGEDEVGSYTALRSFGVGKDENGNKRLLLNGKPYFHHGVLDQGYWKDSLLTAPSDEAIVKDITLMKEAGFNTIRKHIKIESPRWYWYAAKLGILVWQDAVNGGGKYGFLMTTAPLFLGSHIDDGKHHKLLARRDEEEKKRWQDETVEMVNYLYSQPAIAMWVIFNEAWGQFDSAVIYEKVKKADPTRTVDINSGWHDQGLGDFASRHVYFRPYKFRKDKLERSVLLSEFGGYGLDTEGKSEKKMFSYKKISNEEELTESIVSLYERDVVPYIPKGLSASIYTQLSDVEQERNGLITYDRRHVKVDTEKLRKMSEKIKI